MLFSFAQSCGASLGTVNTAAERAQREGVSSCLGIQKEEVWREPHAEYELPGRFIAFMLARNIRMEEELDRPTLQLE